MQWEKNKDRNQKICDLLNQGESITHIAKILDISKSTVHYWASKLGVRHSSKVLARIAKAAIQAREKAVRSNSERARRRRIDYQKIGVNECYSSNLHMMGCMLYWAEGSKERNSVRFANTDPDMMRLFVDFIRESFDILDVSIKIKCRNHEKAGPGLQEIENFWLKTLQLPKSSLQKGSTETRTCKYPHKYVNGICYVVVNNTEVVQRIFGAIGEYVGVDSTKWL